MSFKKEPTVLINISNGLFRSSNYLYFLKRYQGPIPASFNFRSLLIPTSNTVSFSTLHTEKSIDGVFGIRTQACRMVGADITTELWRTPILFIFWQKPFSVIWIGATVVEWLADVEWNLTNSLHGDNRKRVFWPVWLDVGVKSSPIFHKSSQCSFYIGVRFLKIAQQLQSFWASFARNFVGKNFQKIAQSCHTASDYHLPCDKCENYFAQNAEIIIVNDSAQFLSSLTFSVRRHISGEIS